MSSFISIKFLKIHAQKHEWEGKNSKQSLNHSIFSLSFGMEIIVTVVEVIVEWVWNQKGTVHHRQATGTSDKMKKFATISDFFFLLLTPNNFCTLAFTDSKTFSFYSSSSCRYIFNLIESSLIGKIASIFFVKAASEFSSSSSKIKFQLILLIEISMGQFSFHINNQLFSNNRHF